MKLLEMVRVMHRDHVIPRGNSRKSRGKRIRSKFEVNMERRRLRREAEEKARFHASAHEMAEMFHAMRAMGF